jgi:hypothetical protein
LINSSYKLSLSSFGTNCLFLFLFGFAFEIILFEDEETETQNSYKQLVVTSLPAKLLTYTSAGFLVSSLKPHL